MKKLHRASDKAELTPDYPLQGTALDIPLGDLLAFSPEERTRYIERLLSGFERAIDADEMALKSKVPFRTEMRDLRRALYSPVDEYLYTDEKTLKRNVLARGSPGSTHTYWSRNQMWKMSTKAGNLQDKIINRSPSLLKKLDGLFDPGNSSKAVFRTQDVTAVRAALTFLQYDHSSGTAFPPFHARFFADQFLPNDGDAIVLDPCAGWGGRLIGTLLVPRAAKITYVGVDPQKRNKSAYDGLIRRASIWLKKEIPGERSARVFYQPFEDWIHSKTAKKLMGCIDLAITSPPYFSAENYDSTNRKQSANRYSQYDVWRDRFYQPLIHGVRELLKPGGHFVLNVANVTEAPRLEADAKKLAEKAGFKFVKFYKLAMSVYATARKGKMKRAVTVRGVTYKYEAVFIFQK